MHKSLEERLESIDTEENRKNFEKTVKNGKYELARLTNLPYPKYSLVEEIAYRMTVPGEYWKDLYFLYNRLNWGTLCYPYLGSVAVKVDEDILRKLTPWERLYLYAGFKDKEGKHNHANKYLPEVIGEYIQAGINKIYKEHYLRKNGVKGKRKYIRDIKLPESQFYKKELRNKQIAEYKKKMDFLSKYKSGEQMKLFEVGDTPKEGDIKIYTESNQANQDFSKENGQMTLWGDLDGD